MTANQKATTPAEITGAAMASRLDPIDPAASLALDSDRLDRLAGGELGDPRATSA